MIFWFLGWYISGAQLSAAQFVNFSGRIVGPWTTGPRGPICHGQLGPTVRGPIVRGPICLEPFLAMLVALHLTLVSKWVGCSFGLALLRGLQACLKIKRFLKDMINSFDVFWLITFWPLILVLILIRRWSLAGWRFSSPYFSSSSIFSTPSRPTRLRF